MRAPPLTSTADALRPSGPDPSSPPGRTIRVVARVLLWTLIGIAALHGVLPPLGARREPGPIAAPAHAPTDRRWSPSQGSTDQVAMATAASFLREYLTVDGQRAARPARLKRYLARGVEVDDAVVPELGISQSTDLVLPAGAQPTKAGMEVTVIAHLLRTRDGQSEDGGTVAFVIPTVTGSGGTAVSGIPRPAALPVDRTLTSRPVALPTALAHASAAIAGQAVAAMLNADQPALVRLGGGAAPVVRPFPDGWRPVGIMSIRPAGPPETPTVQVLVRARPPVAGIEYLVPVRVSLRRGASSPIVREVDAGGVP